ncbi:DUF6541 family protein [Actinomyces sp. Z5]|uniref:DUF6541 family protein n=1 Tax=Actinomyces sp. Z5 TaxID=2250216 RepID=UPI0028528CDE|nr:DUF6541 family protein [Actinomyces sp. Z5]
MAPGALLLRAVGAPGRVALPAGPAATVFIVGTVSTVMKPLGIPWTPISGWTVLIGCAVTGCLVQYGRRRLLGRRHAAVDPSIRSSWVPALFAVGGIAMAATLQLIVLTSVSRSADALLQNHDAMFHLNLIEETYRSGNASMFSAAKSLNGGQYYPNTWHTLASLLRPVVSTPAAFNIMLVLVCAMVVPFALVCLTRAAGGGGIATLVAPALGCASIWLPGFMVTFNAQVAAAWAIAIALSAAAAMLVVIRLRSTRLALGVGAVAVGGTTMAHAGAGQWLIIVMLFAGAVWLVGSPLSSGSALRRSVLAVAMVALPLSTMMAIPQLRVMGAYNHSVRPLETVVKQTLWLDPIDGSIWDNVLLVLLALTGVVILLHSRRLMLPAVWGSTVVLSVITALPEGPWWALTGGWWGDNNRYLATLALLSGCLAAIALETCAGARRTGKHARMPITRRMLGAVMACILVMFVAIPGVERFDFWTRRGYDETALVHPSWISSEERSTLEALPPGTLDDAVVYGVPSSGAALVPVLSAGNAFVRIDTSRSLPSAQEYLAVHFNEINSDPRVCEIINRNGGEPMYYDDTTLDEEKASNEFPGYRDVDVTHGFELVAQLDTATLWRITACDGQ